MATKKAAEPKKAAKKVEAKLQEAKPQEVKAEEPKKLEEPTAQKLSSAVEFANISEQERAEQPYRSRSVAPWEWFSKR